MTQDDDDIRAMESRLRQNGWGDMAPARPPTKHRKIAPPPTRFGGLDSRIKEAVQQLADDHNGYSWPLISDIARAYRFSYDDAVRALAEAKRLSGVLA